MLGPPVLGVYRQIQCAREDGSPHTCAAVITHMYSRAVARPLKQDILEGNRKDAQQLLISQHAMST